MGKYKCCNTKIISSNSCTRTLSKFVYANFNEGDIIGLTFINEGIASIATGIFVKIIGEVVVVKDLLLKDTTSLIPLCDVSSVEKGITSNTRNKPLSVNLK